MRKGYYGVSAHTPGRTSTEGTRRARERVLCSVFDVCVWSTGLTSGCVPGLYRKPVCVRWCLSVFACSRSPRILSFLMGDLFYLPIDSLCIATFNGPVSNGVEQLLLAD